MITSEDAEKTPDKIQNQLIVKSSKIGIEVSFLKLIESIYYKSIANFTFNGEKFKTFLLLVMNKQRVFPLTTSFQLLLEVLVNVIKQETEITE